MMSGRGLLCDGEFMHVRCCAHILNLIVKEGLELGKYLLHDIRESVRYMKASQTRILAFAACVERVVIKNGADLSLDVPTRWNSTYEILVRALIFRKAFTSLKTFNPNYKSLPSEEDWNRGEKICELLKPFNIITTHFSGSKYPTSSVYFTQVWRIELLLRKFSNCDDDDLRLMAEDMQVKFAKNWDILAMGAILDPRMKLEILEKAYETVDPTTSASKAFELKSKLKLLYEDYQTRTWASSSGASCTQTPHEIVTESPLEDDMDNLERSITVGARNTKSHLDIYLEEDRVNRKLFPNLDVLSYWRDNEHRLGDLAHMARDILSIPITTVASESAFSIGALVLTPYRNRMLPENVQALLCTRNWLRGFAEYEGSIEENVVMDTEDTRKTSNSSGVECSRY